MELTGPGSLQTLNLSRSKVSDAGVEQFKKSRPGIKILR
jgi:hypothetical protein